MREQMPTFAGRKTARDEQSTIMAGVVPLHSDPGHFMETDMTILVDCNPSFGSRYPYLMVSDDCAEELIRFGSCLGLKKEWLRNDNGLTHFRINWIKREEALRKGARAASMKEICKLLKGNSGGNGKEPGPEAATDRKDHRETPRLQKTRGRGLEGKVQRRTAGA